MSDRGQLARLLLLFLLALSASSSLGNAASTQQQPEETPYQIGAIVPYLGLTIDDIEFPDVDPSEAAVLVAATQLKVGQPLTREGMRDAMKALFASGRFSDIQAEAERTQTVGVRIRFRTVANYFVGIITVTGVSSNPSVNQLVGSSRLQLGELYTKEKVDRSITAMQRILEDNGFFMAKISSTVEPIEAQHQTNVNFFVETGPRATVGTVTVEGDAGYTAGEIKYIAKFHSGDPLISNRVTRALQRIRSRYRKQERLLAQVAISDRKYQPQRNVVDYTFQIDRGPVVQIEAEGFKLSQRTLRRLVPIYEEGAVDDDLLNEGRRSIENHLQTLGYFQAKVGVTQHNVQDGKALQVLYTVDPGERHKLVAVRITGNKYFPDELIRQRMQEEAAGRLFSHGRYSEELLEADTRSIENLYRASGFRQAQVNGSLINNYQGNPTLLGIQIDINEGPQTRVAWVRLDGNYTLPEEQLPETQTAENQGFDERSLADDRDTILSKYFDDGFPNATVDVAYVNAPAGSDGLPRVGVTFTIHEGEQFFVNQVFLDGLYYTRPGVARRELRVHPGDPLSQRDMLETQRRLYDLGLFSEVDAAVQNPDGTESRKNVVITAREAKRYTFDYGGGFEFQTGQPSIGTNQPLGQTGVSPRVAAGISRINLFGRQQTLSFKGNLSRLQQRGLINLDVPKLLNRENLHFSATVFYDNTVDVSTFTSRRLEGTIRNLQVLYRVGDRELTTISYGFSYREVHASNIQVTSNLIPLLSRPTRVGSPNFVYVRNRRDNDLETTRGSYTSVEGGIAAGIFGSEADFSRVLIKNSTYYSFWQDRVTGKKFVFARSTSVGLENPFGNTTLLDPSQTLSDNRSLIPLPERFFMGGGNSHRGFGLNQAGPRDPFTGFPVGGSALFLNNLELRFPSIMMPLIRDNIGFSIFHDVGNVFARPNEMVSSLDRWHQPSPSLCLRQDTHLKCDYNYLSHALGVGVQYLTPIGPLRLDIGYNLNPPVFPSYTNISTNTVTGNATGQFGAQRAGHVNFSFTVGQSF